MTNLSVSVLYRYSKSVFDPPAGGNRNRGRRWEIVCDMRYQIRDESKTHEKYENLSNIVSVEMQPFIQGRVAISSAGEKHAAMKDEQGQKIAYRTWCED